MIPVYIFQNNQYAIYFTSDDMISKLEAFKNHILDKFYLIEITRIGLLQIRYKYSDEEKYLIKFL